MEEQTQSVPTLCRMGCGFFGNSATEDMCSKCFRDYQRRKQDTAQQQRSPQTSSQPQVNRITQHPSSAIEEDTDSGLHREVSSSRSFSSARYTSNNSKSCAMEGEVQATPLSDLPASSHQLDTPTNTPVSLNKTPKKNRCFMCRKKVGLTGFHCRCGEQFCALHRYADKHSCTYDYKTAGREELERRHPKVVAAKIQKL